MLLSELLIRRKGLDAFRIFGFVFRGVGFGFLYPLAMQELMRRLYDGLYNGKEWIFERPQNEGWFRYRMPAALVIGSNRPVSGVLHLGRPGLLFVPNRKSSAKHKPVKVAPIGGIAPRIVDPPPQTLRQKIYIPNPQRLLEFSAGSQTVCFQIPLVDDTAELLSGLLRALQAEETDS
jgi:hypothetical protein